MNYTRNGGVQFPSFKSNQSYQNYKPQYFGVKTNDQPKKFTSFNSLGYIENNGGFNDLKMFPTATSMKSIPETSIEQPQKIDIFKNILMLAASNKWTENDITNKWTDIAQLIKIGFKGSKKDLKKYFESNNITNKTKRSRSEELHKHIKIEQRKVHQQQLKQSPKLQRFHSLNYQQPIPKRKIIQKYLAKSVQVKQKKHYEQKQILQQSKDDKLLKLCCDIQSILGQGQRRLLA